MITPSIPGELLFLYSRFYKGGTLEEAMQHFQQIFCSWMGKPALYHE